MHQYQQQLKRLATAEIAHLLRQIIDIFNTYTIHINREHRNPNEAEPGTEQSVE